MAKLSLTKETLLSLDAKRVEAVVGARFTTLVTTGPSVENPCIPPTELRGCWQQTAEPCCLQVTFDCM